MDKSDQISQIMTLIFTVRQLFHEKVVDKACAKVSPVQIMSLRFIEKRKPVMKEIADFLGITPPSVTVLIDNFIEQGLVKREEESHDRRIVRIVLTKKGEKFITNNKCEVFQKIRKNLGDLSLTEQKQLAQILTKIINGYKNNF